MCVARSVFVSIVAQATLRALKGKQATFAECWVEFAINVASAGTKVQACPACRTAHCAHTLLHPLTSLLSPRGLSFPSVKHLHVNKRQLNAGCSHILIISNTMHCSANVEQQEPYSARSPLPPSTLGKTDACLKIHICCSFNACSCESHKTSHFTPQKINVKYKWLYFAWRKWSHLGP